MNRIQRKRLVAALEIPFRALSSLQTTVDQGKELCARYRVGRFQDATQARHLLDTVVRQYQQTPLAINVAIDLLQRLSPSDPAIINPVLNAWKNLVLSNKRHLRRSVVSLDTVLEKLDMILPGNAVTIGILIQVMLQQKSIAEAKTFMEEQKDVVQWNTQLYNQILKAHVDRRDPPSEIESVLSTMQDSGVVRDKYTYSILMHYWKDDDKRVQAILDAADESVVDAACWSQWVQYTTRRHHVVIENVEAVILQRILGKDPHQLGLSARDVLDAYNRRFADWPDTVGRAEAFLRKVRSHVAPHLEGSLLRIMMDIYVKAGNHTKVEETFYEIKNPTAAAYMILIRIFRTTKQPDKAAKVLHEVLKESSYRIAPTVAMFNLVLETFLLVDDSLDKALLVWHWMQHDAKCQILGLKPSMSTFALLMRLCLHNGVSASSFLDQMKAQFRLQPTPLIYMLALESLLLNPETLDFPAAERIAQQLGHEASTAVEYETIVRSYPCTQEAAQHAIDAFERQDGNAVSEVSFHLVLAILAQTSRQDTAVGDMASSFYNKHHQRFRGGDSTSLPLLVAAKGKPPLELSTEHPSLANGT